MMGEDVSFVSKHQTSKWKLELYFNKIPFEALNPQENLGGKKPIPAPFQEVPSLNPKTMVS